MTNNLFLEGYLTALYDYAHYNDGIMYVGSCGKTYKEAEQQAIKEYGDGDVTSQM